MSAGGAAPAFNRRRCLELALTSLAFVAASPAHAGIGALDRLLNGALGTGVSASADDQIAAGLREALRIGAELTIARVQVVDGFNLDPSIHIKLPKKIEKARKWLRRLGMSATLDDLELQMNRAAENAAPKAKRYFVDAIAGITFDDARTILGGAQDAATRFLRSRTESPLTAELRPLVDDSLAQVGAVTTMRKLVESYRQFPLAPALDTDLTGYVVQRALDGLFHYVAKEEAAIRKDPVRRTTALLRTVFGS